MDSNTTLPIKTTKKLVPEWSYLSSFCSTDKSYKGKQKQDYDTRYHVHKTPEILDDTEVWVTTDKERPTRGKIDAHVDSPWSYVLETPIGEVRRNHQQLNPIPEDSVVPPSQDTHTSDSEETPSQPSEECQSCQPGESPGRETVLEQISPDIFLGAYEGRCEVNLELCLILVMSSSM